jgi:hypothetical protein
MLTVELGAASSPRAFAAGAGVALGRRLMQPPGFRLILIALALAGQACFALTSSGPVGPMRSGDATQLGANWSYAYGPATATVGGAVVKGNGQMQAAGGDAPQIPSPSPVTVGVRQAFGDNVELSGDLGFIDSGVRLRVGLPAGPAMPFDIALEARDGQVSLAPTASYHGSVALELYPDITTPNSFPRRRLILSVGVAGGVFQHQLSLPFSFAPDDDLPLGGPTMTLLRPEVRLETAFGVYLGGDKNDGISIVLAPWFLLGSGAPSSASCKGCSDVAFATPFSVTDYSQTWGISLIFTPSYGWLHSP